MLHFSARMWQKLPEVYCFAIKYVIYIRNSGDKKNDKFLAKIQKTTPVNIQTDRNLPHIQMMIF